MFWGFLGFGVYNVFLFSVYLCFGFGYFGVLGFLVILLFVVFLWLVRVYRQDLAYNSLDLFSVVLICCLGFLNLLFAC